MYRLLLVLLLLVPMTAAAQADAGTPPGTEPTQPAEVDPAARVDALWPRRDEKGVSEQIDQLLTQGLKAKGEDFELLWRMARARFWEADGATDERRKKVAGRQAWNYGDRAIRANPKRVEGYYYAGIGIGAYSQAIGILKALGEGLEGKFNKRIDTAIELNPELEGGGPLLAKGRYYYELPWPKRDLDKSRALYERVLARHPDSRRAYLYLAETQLKQGDAKAALATIEKAFGPAEYDPPEGRRVHARAKQVKAQIQEELR